MNIFSRMLPPRESIAENSGSLGTDKIPYLAPDSAVAQRLRRLPKITSPLRPHPPDAWRLTSSLARSPYLLVRLGRSLRARSPFVSAAAVSLGKAISISLLRPPIGRSTETPSPLLTPDEDAQPHLLNTTQDGSPM